MNNCRPTFCTFQTDEILCKADAIVAAVGQDREIIYSKSISVQVNILVGLSLEVEPQSHHSAGESL